MLRSIFKKNKSFNYETIPSYEKEKEIKETLVVKEVYTIQNDNLYHTRNDDVLLEKDYTQALLNLIEYHKLCEYDTILNTTFLNRMRKIDIYRINECFNIMSRMNLKNEDVLNKCYFCYNIFNIFINSERLL
jgi:hypothetical protein